MSEYLASATLTLSVEGAPEVKGTVAYITPHRVEWQVSESRHGDRVFAWIRAVLTGPSRKGRWAGAVIYDYGEVPAWLPIPRQWIERAARLVSSDPVSPNEGVPQ